MNMAAISCYSTQLNRHIRAVPACHLASPRLGGDWAQGTRDSAILA